MQKKDTVEKILRHAQHTERNTAVTVRHSSRSSTIANSRANSSTNSGYGWAPANLALCKYWGKRNDELNLPCNSSLSISLGKNGTFTLIEEIISDAIDAANALGDVATANSANLPNHPVSNHPVSNHPVSNHPVSNHNQSDKKDICILNGQEIAPRTAFAKRLRSFLDLFRPSPQTVYRVRTISTIPVAAGLASSASGYAALTLALDDLYAWQLPRSELALLARLGSGSACRSLWHGFVEWHRGGSCNDNGSKNRSDGNTVKSSSDGNGSETSSSDESNNINASESVDPDNINNNVNNSNNGDDDGMDSYAAPLPLAQQDAAWWSQLRIGIILVAAHAKAISSRDAMRHTMQTAAPFYAAWPTQAAHDLATIKHAIATRDFALLGETSEHNSMLMHALMHSARAPIVYAQPATLAAMERVWDLRRANILIFFTQDAGPNLKLLFLEQHTHIVMQSFPEITIVAPFAATATKDEELILVDENDKELGVGEKMAVHLRGDLHRAFSVLIFRRYRRQQQRQCAEEKHNDNDNGNDTVDYKLEVLLQQRSAHKYHSANLWTNTCCGHPRPHEGTLQATARRLEEEMGIKAIELREVGAFHYRAELAASGLVENEIDHVLVGEVSVTVDTTATTDAARTAAIHPNNQEVQNYCWIDVDALRSDLAANPSAYTAWLGEVMRIAISSLLSSTAGCS